MSMMWLGVQRVGRCATVALCGLVLVLGLGLVSNTKALGQDVMKVEEIWEMTVNTPDPTNAAPQLNTVMSAYEHVDSYYGLLTVNYQDLPNFSQGGLQAQIWQDTTNLSDVLLTTDGVVNKRVLSKSGETVKWSQALQLSSEGVLVFSIQGLKGETWRKDFTLATKAATPGLANLNQYNPKVSVMYTRNWGLGLDRIKQLRLRTIRKYDAKGNRLSEDKVEIVVMPF
jgi:hypothetical protein